ncbi:hypothetical protein Desaci_4733 (plasmid) [Desulfosporosinus acidiphilus SJ4]|uniref:Uncharacterized protein n=1 Tax=Desulfosporosinus acidiphilus (strain DSM 22704 / JCM 16185 / SJ4) TaxID=646529 RepID=I4DCN6_DESAJ|nr:hypothetical protein [Desulfosporosinus acidiphilus]AFM43560.1 hypothetical protein Desaci_4733 [Desulfosporosinus acidiphilus SJ4]
MPFFKLNLFYLRLKDHMRSLKSDERGYTTLEIAIVIGALVVFLGISIPSLLGHFGSLFNRAGSKVDSLGF